MLSDTLNSPESRRLLKIIDDMREILHHEKIPLPHIVVVGDQSVGKSSVLEALSGVQLPRAQNICTRCPLELRMKHIPSSLDECATIRCDGVSEIKINDFSEIANAVTNCTNKLAGLEHGVSSSPIYLTVYKNNIQEDLTLVDLPGITRNPVGGQAEDIYQQIINLIEHYIEPKTTVVLHVIPSLVDFTTSESIQLAKKSDPECERQLIAVSKIDKFDKGIGEKLQGVGAGAMALKLGCVAVLNRTQEEIDQNISFSEMRCREKQFFRTQKAFENVPERYLGSDQLVRQLAHIQQDRIRSTLPAIMDELKKQIKTKKIELKNMPPSVTTEIECWTIYNDLVRRYRDTIYARVNGIYDNDLQMKMFDLQGKRSGTTTTTTAIWSQSKDEMANDHIAFQIHKQQKQCGEQFHELFSHFFTREYRKMVLELLEENAGVALPNFPSFTIIERLYRGEQSKFGGPCEKLIESCSEYCKEVLIKLLNQAFANETNYKNKMLPKLTDIVLRALDESEEKCNIDLQKILCMEQRVFTLNHYYMDTVNKIKNEFQKYNENIKTNGGKPTSSSTLFVNDIVVDVNGLSNEHQAAVDVQIAIAAYCRVVEKCLIDHVSQLCYYYFITQCALVLDSKLSSAFTSAMLFEWMQEPFSQQQIRENLKRSIDAMERALAMGQTA